MFVEWNLTPGTDCVRACRSDGDRQPWHAPGVFTRGRPAPILHHPYHLARARLGFAVHLSETWRYELYFTTTLDRALDSSGSDRAAQARRKANRSPDGRMERIRCSASVWRIFFASDLRQRRLLLAAEQHLTLSLAGCRLSARCAAPVGMEARAVWAIYMPNSGTYSGVPR